ncbi:MAG: hypothetical protein J5746_01360 [Victivallales bacterium]|nr:hypothetical protein [Victivallales bacterium]
MYKPKLKDWPYSHVRLMHITVSGLALSLLVLWLLVYPSWRRLKSMRQETEAVRIELEKRGIQLDEAVLSRHISDCIASLAGDETRLGLVDVAGNAMALAMQTFADEINSAYAGESGTAAKQSAVEKFVEGSTRIDYKVLYDRVYSECAKCSVDISQATISPDEDSNEPVYQQMLKLWTLRFLVGQAVENGLSFEAATDNAPAIRALRSRAYLNDGSERTYLLEFPVMLRLQGKLENFISFAKSLQGGRRFLPIKSIEIHSTPPADFPPGERRELENLHFRIICSAFFVEPQPSSGDQANTEAKPEN